MQSTTGYKNTPECHDHLNLRSKPSITNQLDPNELILFSCEVVKYNKYCIKQSRSFLLTTERVCNFKKDVLKREIKVTSLLGITKSLEKGHSHFVIHVVKDYDYRYVSDKYMDQIIDAIKKCYYEKTIRNLPVYGVPSKVKKYVQTESEAKKGKGKKVPKENFRLYKEDIDPPTGSFMDQYLTGGGDLVQERGPSLFKQEWKDVADAEQAQMRKQSYLASTISEKPLTPREYWQQKERDQQHQKGLIQQNQYETQNGQDMQSQGQNNEYYYQQLEPYNDQWQQGASQQYTEEKPTPQPQHQKQVSWYEQMLKGNGDVHQEDDMAFLESTQEYTHQNNQTEQTTIDLNQQTPYYDETYNEYYQQPQPYYESNNTPQVNNQQRYDYYNDRNTY